MQDTEPTQKPAPRTPICPLCQHTEFEPIDLQFGGHPGLWYIRKKTKGFRSLFGFAKYGYTKAMRCTNCDYVALFAKDRDTL